MIQIAVIGILFLGAAFYLGRLVYHSFQSKRSCATGCGKCGALDANKIVKDFQKKETSLT